MVYRWNKIVAVGLRYNYDIFFIAMQCRMIAIVFYVINYAIKVEDSVWKWAAAAAEFFHVSGEVPAGEDWAEDAHQHSAGHGGHVGNN